jgi:hypothetical protein
MYDAEWPRRQNSLLFAGLALGRPEYLELWKMLPADSLVEEVLRNFFIRQPVLWVKLSDKFWFVENRNQEARVPIEQPGEACSGEPS